MLCKVLRSEITASIQQVRAYTYIAKCFHFAPTFENFHFQYAIREPVRVCEKCHERIIQMRTPFVSQFINSSEGGSDPQQGGTPPSSSSTVGSWRNSSANSLNIERSLDTAGNRCVLIFIPVFPYFHSNTTFLHSFIFHSKSTTAI